MNRIFKLRNPVKEYAWGDFFAIQDLLGLSREAFSRPMAELWMGAHASAPSRVQIGKEAWMPLDELIAGDPEAVLGSSVARIFSGRLPFLFKVLAVRTPLSIQVHPNAEQAEQGFRRENSAGLAPDDSGRSYRDASHKPELLCALTPFHALEGFRPVEDMLRLLDRIAPTTLAGEIRILQERPDAAGLRAFMERLLRLDEKRQGRVRKEVLSRTQDRRGDAAGPLEWIARLAKEFSGDMGILAPALMNLVVLEPGEALWIEAGRMHAYLLGTGVEIMANSDNVVRGGLTEKHVDPAELLRIVSFESGAVRPVPAQGGSQGLCLYPVGASEFLLGRIRITPSLPFRAGPRRGVEIHLCVEGSGSFLIQDQEVRFSRGASLLVPDAARGYRIEGEAVLYRASVPAEAPQAEA